MNGNFAWPLGTESYFFHVQLKIGFSLSKKIIRTVIVPTSFGINKYTIFQLFFYYHFGRIHFSCLNLEVVDGPNWLMEELLYFGSIHFFPYDIGCSNFYFFWNLDVRICILLIEQLSNSLVYPLIMTYNNFSTIVYRFYDIYLFMSINLFVHLTIYNVHPQSYTFIHKLICLSINSSIKFVHLSTTIYRNSSVCPKLFINLSTNSFIFPHPCP